MTRTIGSFLISHAVLLALPAARWAQPDEFTPQKVRAFADYLWEREEYGRALLEYQRLMYLDSLESGAYARLQAARCFWRVGQPAQALPYLEGSTAHSPGTHDSMIVLKALCELRSGRAERMQRTQSDTALQNWARNETMVIRALRWMQDQQWDSVSRIQSDDYRLQLLTREAAQYRRRGPKSPVVAGVMSAVLPGSGKLYAGRAADGCSIHFLWSAAVPCWPPTGSHGKELPACAAGFLDPQGRSFMPATCTDRSLLCGTTTRRIEKRCWEMLRRALRYGLISSLFVVPRIAAQDLESTFDLAEYQSDQGNSDAAVTEYLRFICFGRESPLWFYACYKCGLAYASLHDWRRATAMFDQALDRAPEPFRGTIRYHRNFSLLESGDFTAGMMGLFALSRSSSSRAVARHASLSLLATYAHQDNWEAAAKLVERLLAEEETSSDTLYRSALQEIQTDISSVRREDGFRSPGAAKWLSTFVPGSGHVYAGKPAAGLNALALNGVTSYFLSQAAADRRAVDFLLIFGLVWHRYYWGNRLHAEEAAIQHNEDIRKRVFEKITARALMLVEDLDQDRPIIRRSDIR